MGWSALSWLPIKPYDTKDFVMEMRGMKVTPHVSQNVKRPGGSSIDGRTTRHAGDQVSQRKRKRIEEVFGWIKTVGMLRKTRHAAWKQSGGSLPSRPPLTTSCECAICYTRQFNLYKSQKSCVLA